MGRPRKQAPAPEPDIEQARMIAFDIWNELLFEVGNDQDYTGTSYARKVGYVEAQMKYLLAALGERAVKI